MENKIILKDIGEVSGTKADHYCCRTEDENFLARYGDELSEKEGNYTSYEIIKESVDVYLELEYGVLHLLKRKTVYSISKRLSRPCY